MAEYLLYILSMIHTLLAVEMIEIYLSGRWVQKLQYTIYSMLLTSHLSSKYWICLLNEIVLYTAQFVTFLLQATRSIYACCLYTLFSHVLF
ncbi:unnamed protein product [Heterobilharzia americana]|nr:unnamed protein product [Heterobilharzia americana]